MPELSIIVSAVPQNFFECFVLQNHFQDIETFRNLDDINEVYFLLNTKLDESQFTICASEVASFAVEEYGYFGRSYCKRDEVIVKLIQKLFCITIEVRGRLFIQYL